jgi:putative restriction endonuclease
MSVRDTIILSPSDLKYLLIDSLRLYSDNVVFLDGNNPYRFSINKKTFYVLIKNIHESGDGRGNQDECRIQISRTRNFNEALSSKNDVIVLGYFADENVFTAWNPFLLRDRFNEKQTVSVYSRFSTLKTASSFRIATYRDSNGQSIISFKPEYLGLYLENISKIHLLSDEDLIELIDFSDNLDDAELEGTALHLDEGDLTVTHTRYKRDTKFRGLVYDAYEHRCAMCGIQLELVEAAHIVPHSHEKGTDEVNNGICLCPIHHSAYDRGLIYFNENYDIKINNAKMTYLEKIGKDAGFRKFQTLGFDKIRVPDNHTLRPNISYISLANSIRGIDET